MSKRTPFEKTLTSQAHYPDQYFFQLIQTPLFQVQAKQVLMITFTVSDDDEITTAHSHHGRSSDWRKKEERKALTRWLSCLKFECICPLLSPSPFLLFLSSFLQHSTGFNSSISGGGGGGGFSEPSSRAEMWTENRNSIAFTISPLSLSLSHFRLQDLSFFPSF